MDTKTLEQKAGSRKAVCKLLGISSAAVSQWHGVIPQARLWQIKSLKPEWFTSESSADQPRTEGASA